MFIQVVPEALLFKFIVSVFRNGKVTKLELLLDDAKITRRVQLLSDLLAQSDWSFKDYIHFLASHFASVQSIQTNL